MTTAPPDRVLRDAQHVSVACPTLGLTLYLTDMIAWARGAATAALAAWLRHCPAGSPTWYTTSGMADWEPVLGDTMPALLEQVSSPDLLRVRHLFWFRVVDDTGAPSAGFSYRETNEARGPGGWLQLFLPEDTDPGRLLALTEELADLAPFLCGVGGHLASWNAHEKPTAFWDIRDWCRRHLGLDVQDPDQMAWHARQRLPGTSWLTLIGDPFEARADALAAVETRPGPFTVTRRKHGLLVRAGERPDLGDVNTLTFPAAYAAVARRLAPFLVTGDELEFPGGFVDHGDTGAWLRRFVEPEGWS
jgi:hypothetical protein